MNKGDKILMKDGMIMEFVGKILPDGNSLKFKYRFEALNKSAYADTSFEGAMLCRVAYLEHQIKAMELGVPPVYAITHSKDRGAFILSESQINSMNLQREFPVHNLEKYVYEGGIWVHKESKSL